MLVLWVEDQVVSVSQLPGYKRPARIRAAASRWWEGKLFHPSDCCRVSTPPSLKTGKTTQKELALTLIFFLVVHTQMYF